MKSKKRAPVVLERWFGPQRPRDESLGSGGERRGSEDCPDRNQEGSKGSK